MHLITNCNHDELCYKLTYGYKCNPAPAYVIKITCDKIAWNRTLTHSQRCVKQVYISSLPYTSSTFWIPNLADLVSIFICPSHSPLTLFFFLKHISAQINTIMHYGLGDMTFSSRQFFNPLIHLCAHIWSTPFTHSLSMYEAIWFPLRNKKKRVTRSFLCHGQISSSHHH